MSRLARGRVDYLAGRPAAALCINGGNTINLFVVPHNAASPVFAGARSVRGFHVRRWSREGMTFCAVSDLSGQELTEFVRALQESQ